ncbi:hypothetical protein DIPPA_27904 [Diplonema papillatum]|nr:hypothetical protein DIPPA_27904 [Diplonema papillatum]
MTNVAVLRVPVSISSDAGRKAFVEVTDDDTQRTIVLKAAAALELDPELMEVECDGVVWAGKGEDTPVEELGLTDSSGLLVRLEQKKARAVAVLRERRMVPTAVSRFQLLEAVEVGDVELMEALFDMGVPLVEGMGVRETTALHVACRMGHEGAAGLILDRIERVTDTKQFYQQRCVNVHADDGATPLGCLAFARDEKAAIRIADRLTDMGATPLATDAKGNTALHLAIDHQKFDFAVHLLTDDQVGRALCTVPNFTTRDTALHRACLHDALFVVKAILRHCKAVDSAHSQSAVSQATGNPAKKYRRQVDAVNNGLETPLHFAITRPSLISLLINNGASKDARDCMGRTPLFLACRLGRVNSVAALLEQGANPSLADVAGATPYQAVPRVGTAARLGTGSEVIQRMLVKAGGKKHGHVTTGCKTTRVLMWCCANEPFPFRTRASHSLDVYHHVRS